MSPSSSPPARPKHPSHPPCALRPTPDAAHLALPNAYNQVGCWGEGQRVQPGGLLGVGGKGDGA